MIIPAIGIGPLGTDEWAIPGVSGLSAVAPVNVTAGSASTTGASSSGSFGTALTNAIGSLENTQATATTTAEKLATGQLTDPTTAITAAENAQLAMQFASQVRNGLDTDVTTLMQTSF